MCQSSKGREIWYALGTFEMGEEVRRVGFRNYILNGVEYLCHVRSQRWGKKVSLFCFALILL